jgi:hypothetical protein
VKHGGLGLPVRPSFWTKLSRLGRHYRDAVFLWSSFVYHHRPDLATSPTEPPWCQEASGSCIWSLDDRHSLDPAFTMGGRTYEMDDVDGRHPFFHLEMLCSICMAVSPAEVPSLISVCVTS